LFWLLPCSILVVDLMLVPLLSMILTVAPKDPKIYSLELMILRNYLKLAIKTFIVGKSESLALSLSCRSRSLWSSAVA
jgi:hypothetical protein